MFSKIKQYLGIACAAQNALVGGVEDDAYQFQRTHEEAKKRRKAKKKAKADRAARKRNRRK